MMACAQSPDLTRRQEKAYPQELSQLPNMPAHTQKHTHRSTHTNKNLTNKQIYFRDRLGMHVSRVDQPCIKPWVPSPAAHERGDAHL